VADDDLTPPDDPRAPLWARILGFVAVLACFAALVAIVLVQGRDRDERAGTGEATAETVALPADNGGSLVSPTRVPTPSGTGPATVPRRPRTGNDVAIELERVLKRDIGFTHKVSCYPNGPLTPDTVLECHAASEPPIKEAPPSSIVAVVVGEDGRVVWARTEGDSYTLAALTADPDQTCEALAAKGYAYVLAFWQANGRPATLDPADSGRPCRDHRDQFSDADVDAALAAAR
jgi:hypothetical protein